MSYVLQKIQRFEWLTWTVRGEVLDEVYGLMSYRRYRGLKG